ncbi:MAG: sugar-binding domain-containing protein [Aeromonas sp.]
MRACEHVIGLAGGLDKSNAIRGALAGGYLDVLIIDYPTACTLI